LISGTTPSSAANGVFLSAGSGGGVFAGKLETEFLKISGGVTPDKALYATQAYDATNVILAALQKIKPSTNLTTVRSELIAALHKTTYMGVTGKISFQSDGNLAGSGKGGMDYYQVQGGKIVQIGHN
jgi:ABC-type branched-subunit amino acid transport system substrate-binding protein